MIVEEIHRFPNGMVEKDGQKVWNVDALYEEIKAGMRKCKELNEIPVSMGIDTWAVDFVMMEQFVPVFSEIVDKEEIADSLNISTSEIMQDLPVQIISTGLRDILVPVTSVEILNAMQPDMEKIKEISRKYSTVGYHVFSLENEEGVDAYCRNFAPLYDIPEEAATGTSNGALAGYLYHYGKVNNDHATNLNFKQGYSMKKPSEIHASLEVCKNEIQKVRVGGSARNLREVEITIE